MIKRLICGFKKKEAFVCATLGFMFWAGPSQQPTLIVKIASACLFLILASLNEGEVSNNVPVHFSVIQIIFPSIYTKNDFYPHEIIHRAPMLVEV